MMVGKFKVETGFKVSPKIGDINPKRKATIKTWVQFYSQSSMCFQALLNKIEQMNREHNSKTIRGRFKNIWNDIKRFFKWNK